jgi:hypothetical protein
MEPFLASPGRFQGTIRGALPGLQAAARDKWRIIENQ